MHPSRESGYRSGSVGAFYAAEPAVEQAQRVVEQRVDLDGLSAPRRDDVAIYLGVHPGERVARSALTKQAVGRIDADAEASAAHVVVDDVAQDRQEDLQRVVVSGQRHV